MTADSRSPGGTASEQSSSRRDAITRRAAVGTAVTAVGAIAGVLTGARLNPDAGPADTGAVPKSPTAASPTSRTSDTSASTTPNSSGSVAAMPDLIGKPLSAAAVLPAATQMRFVKRSGGSRIISQSPRAGGPLGPATRVVLSVGAALTTGPSSQLPVRAGQRLSLDGNVRWKLPEHCARLSITLKSTTSGLAQVLVRHEFAAVATRRVVTPTGTRVQLPLDNASWIEWAPAADGGTIHLDVIAIELTTAQV